MAVGHVSEPVLEPAENPVVHPGFNAVNEQASESAIHRGSRGRSVREKEWEICDAEVRHAFSEITAGLIAEREHAALDEPQNVVGSVAEVEDVVDVLHVHVTPELRGQAIPHLLQGQTEASRGRPVPTDDDPNWLTRRNGRRRLLTGQGRLRRRSNRQHSGASSDR